MFKDHVTIQVQGGKGGDGVVSFRREKFVPRGGPDGGDGGRGGDLTIRADKAFRTLNHFRENQKLSAGNGTAGQGKKKHGKAGENVTIEVPLGTLVYEIQDEKPLFLADLSEQGAELVVAKGGKGGLGNVHFVTSVKQVPRVADLGVEGEKKQIYLELKMIADVGIIGLPNAGKSTLLAAISNAKPKIASYPFTTLDPNLGIVQITKDKIHPKTIVMVDIPGLIEGASQNKGLGHTFLKHVERTGVLIHLIDCSSKNIEEIKKNYTTINQELRKFSLALGQKKQILVFNKIDNLTDEELKQLQNKIKKVFKSEKVCFISAEYQAGLSEMLRLVWKEYQAFKEKGAVGFQPQKVFQPLEEGEKNFVITRKKGKWHIAGTKVEQIVQQTRLDNEESLMRMFQLLQKTGIVEELEKQGVMPGDEVRVGKYEFTWG